MEQMLLGIQTLIRLHQGIHWAPRASIHPPELLECYLSKPCLQPRTTK